MLFPPITPLVDNRFGGFTAVSQGKLGSKGLLAENEPSNEFFLFGVIVTVGMLLRSYATDVIFQDIEPKWTVLQQSVDDNGVALFPDKHRGRGDGTPLLAGAPDS